ncbi:MULTISPECIES: thermonuclease family protein [unclassified Paenibacillus]|uniref:thermonuclease family protein n=1 Tax=unclassified Paenibacillus TaxID=185978 RepID=UPI00277F0DDD|nr:MULTISPECIES: thermonuclease family protein [unclassified Paenibacillus]MDQ0899864.1 micrococcal nuclease [Paenibacillus sp. V4I7]MDQ0914182.1 micrococcal nuclease [Paenibacillus sp. V4I5]
MSRQKWYQTTWFLVLLCLVAPYIGIFFLMKRTKNKLILGGVAVWAIIILIGAMATTQTTTAPVAEANKYITAKVTKVVDGDTINVLIGDKKETVRFVLIDTPETKHPSKPVEPFGPEASKFTTDMLEGKEVKLEKDVSERDSYGRLLMYVWLDDKMVNELLLEKGLARVAIYQPDVKYVDKFREIQKKAQQAGTGIWSIENYAKDDGYHPEVMKKTEEPAKETQPSKAPASSTSNSNVSYPNCTAVKAAGKAPLHRGDPGYSSKLDLDNDGVACE